MKTCKIKLRADHEWNNYQAQVRSVSEVQTITGEKVSAAVINGWLEVKVYAVDEGFSSVQKALAFPVSRVLEYSLE